MRENLRLRLCINLCIKIPWKCIEIMNIMLTLKLSLQTSSSTSKNYCKKETSKEGPLHISTYEFNSWNLGMDLEATIINLLNSEFRPEGIYNKLNPKETKSWPIWFWFIVNNTILSPFPMKWLHFEITLAKISIWKHIWAFH